MSAGDAMLRPFGQVVGERVADAVIPARDRLAELELPADVQLALMRERARAKAELLWPLRVLAFAAGAAVGVAIMSGGRR
jgi:hypothetical protein